METAKNLVRHDVPSRDFGSLLRHWRQSRRLSQLELAAEAAVSARHLCFLETGRSQPSREMVQLLGNTLDLPLNEQNTLHLAAGYAPPYGERDLAALDLEHIRHALDFILRQQEPYPGIVLDGRWDIQMRNDASRRLFRPFHEAYEIGDARAENAMHVVFHPKGLRQFIVNWEEFAGSLIQSLHREVAQGGDGAVAQLRDEILAYPGLPSAWKVPLGPSQASPVMPMHLRKGDLDLAFFSTLTTFAMPRDVALQQLKIECFYPADTRTAEVARRLAAADPKSSPSPGKEMPCKP
jgi:transcriptional regulator with XRE-family HTH domain